MFSFYCSDISLFLIDYAWCKLWCKLCNVRLREQHQEFNTGGKRLLRLLLKTR